MVSCREQSPYKVSNMSHYLSVVSNFQSPHQRLFLLPKRCDMFEQSFKNIDNELHKDAGCSTEMDYIEQTSWLLFLKYMEDLENNRALEAELNGRQYNPIINKKYTWSSWAYPQNAEGKLDYDQAMTGDDLILFVKDELFPYLAKFKELADTPDTLEYKIGIIFSEIRNKINDGYIMRNVIGYMQDMRFQTSKEKHELSELYENKIQNMGNSGRNGGEYYTPRPLIRAIIKAVKPQLGNRIYDGACGSAGFLVEAFNYLKESKNLTVDEMEFLQKKTLYGKEFKPLPYIIAIMNMILHGVEAPNIIRKDTLSENIMSIQSKDQYDIVLANPPFGAATSKTDIQNFPIKTSETAYMFVQHFIKSLKAGGRAGLVIKNTFLSNGDAIEVRRELLESCNLYAILDLPSKVFSAGVKTVVLFFKKGEPTQKIWYYQLNLERNLGKTNPLSEKDLADFLDCFNSLKETENSWFVDLADVKADTLDLSVKNPNKSDEVEYREPSEIIADIEQADRKNTELLKKIKELL